MSSRDFCHCDSCRFARMRRIFVAIAVCVASATAALFKDGKYSTGEQNSIDIFLPKSSINRGHLNKSARDYNYWMYPGGYQKHGPSGQYNHVEPLTIQDVLVKPVCVVTPSQNVRNTLSIFHLQNGLKSLHRYQAFSWLQEFFKQPGLKGLIFYPPILYNVRFYDTPISSITVQDDLRMGDFLSSGNYYQKVPYMFVAPEGEFNQMNFEDIVKVSDFKVNSDVIDVQTIKVQPHLASGSFIRTHAVKDGEKFDLGSQAALKPQIPYPKENGIARLPGFRVQRGITSGVQAGSFPRTKVQGGVIAGVEGASIPNINATAIFQKTGGPFRGGVDANAAHTVFQPGYETSRKVDGFVTKGTGAESHGYKAESQTLGESEIHSSRTAPRGGEFARTDSNKYDQVRLHGGMSDHILQGSNGHSEVYPVGVSSADSDNVRSGIDKYRNHVVAQVDIGGNKGHNGKSLEEGISGFGMTGDVDSRHVALETRARGIEYEPQVWHQSEHYSSGSSRQDGDLLRTDSDMVEGENEYQDGNEGSSTLGIIIRGGAAVIGNVADGLVRTGTGIVRTGTEIVGNVTSSVVRTGTGIARTGAEYVGNVTSSVVRTGTGIVRTGTEFVENVGVGLVKTGTEIVKTGAEIAEGVGFGIVNTGSDIVATGTEVVRRGTGVVADVGTGIVKTGTQIVGTVGNDLVEKGTKIVGDVAKIVRSNINETAQNVRNEFTWHHELLELEQPLQSGNISSRSSETESAIPSSDSTPLAHPETKKAVP